MASEVKKLAEMIIQFRQAQAPIEGLWRQDEWMTRFIQALSAAIDERVKDVLYHATSNSRLEFAKLQQKVEALEKHMRDRFENTEGHLDMTNSGG